MLECASDAADQRHSLERGVAEDLLRSLNVGAGEPLAGLGRVEAPVLDGREAEERQLIDDREQVVDRESHDGGRIREVRVVAARERELR